MRVEWAVFAATVCFALSAPAEPLRFVTGDNYPPFTDQTYDGGGAATQLVTRIFTDAGFSVSIDWLPWSDGYDANLTGTYAGTFPYLKSPQRQGVNFFSDPIIEVTDNIVTSAKDGRSFETLDDLHGRVHCTPKGYAVSEPLQALIDDGLLFIAEPRIENRCLESILAGETDFFSLNPFALSSMLRTFGIERSAVRVSEQPLSSFTLHLIVSKGRSDGRRIIKIFNDGLRMLRENGAYDEIMRPAYDEG